MGHCLVEHLVQRLIRTLEMAERSQKPTCYFIACKENDFYEMGLASCLFYKLQMHMLGYKMQRMEHWSWNLFLKGIQIPLQLYLILGKSLSLCLAYLRGLLWTLSSLAEGRNTNVAVYIFKPFSGNLTATWHKIKFLFRAFCDSLTCLSHVTKAHEHTVQKETTVNYDIQTFVMWHGASRRHFWVGFVFLKLLILRS